MWTAHFANRECARRGHRTSFGRSKDFHRLAVQATDVEDEDWARRTQADLPAIQIGRVIVAPPWDLPDAADSGTPRREPRLRTPIRIPRIPAFRNSSSSSNRREASAPAIISPRACASRCCRTATSAGQTMIDVGTGRACWRLPPRSWERPTLPRSTSIRMQSRTRARTSRQWRGRARGRPRRGLHDRRRSPADVVTANLTGTLLARHAAELGRLVRPDWNADRLRLQRRGEARWSKRRSPPAFAITESAEEEDWWAFVLSRLSTPKLLTPNCLTVH